MVAKKKASATSTSPSAAPAKRTRARLASSVGSKAGIAPQAANSSEADYSNVPLFLWYPPNEDRTFLAGVLRKTYKAHLNTATSFIGSKLHPIGEVTASSWQPTAEAQEAILPPQASDSDKNIQRLAERFDAQVLPHKQSLVVYLTIRFPDMASLQEAWELGRAFAYRNLALKRGLATILIQHAPHKMGSPNPQHLHLLILPRKLTSLGFGVFDDAITTDAGLEQLYKEWVQFRRRLR